MGNFHTIDKEMKMYIKSEFERVKAEPQRTYLKVSEVLKLQHPENNPFTFSHLGTLYASDSSKTGCITLNNLLQFAQFYSRNLKNVQTYDPSVGTLHIVVVGLYLQKQSLGFHGMVCEAIRTTNSLNWRLLEIVYDVCNLKIISNIDIQQFLDLLQQAGEEQELMSLDQEELDEYVPLDVCAEFITNDVNGFKSLMIEIGFTDKIIQVCTTEDCCSFQVGLCLTSKQEHVAEYGQIYRSKVCSQGNQRPIPEEGPIALDFNDDSKQVKEKQERLQYLQELFELLKEPNFVPHRSPS